MSTADSSDGECMRGGIGLGREGNRLVRLLNIKTNLASAGTD
jgi:hypothetical protein